MMEKNFECLIWFDEVFFWYWGMANIVMVFLSQKNMSLTCIRNLVGRSEIQLQL